MRWASARDAGTLAALWHRVWHSTYRRHVQPELLKHCTLPFFERRALASLFEHDCSLPVRSRVARSTALLAEHEHGGTRLCGFAIIRGGTQIAHIYVEPEAHGTGVGRELLAAAEHEMYHERGCEVAHLVVSVRNLRALRFYEKYGWIGSDRQAWMKTEPWEAVPVPCGCSASDAMPTQDGGTGVAARETSRLDSESFTSDELEATNMRCTAMKKFLGYDVGIVPRIRSY